VAAAGDRQFFKAAYQGIVDHPDDEHVVATASISCFWVERDYPQRLGHGALRLRALLHGIAGVPTTAPTVWSATPPKRFTENLSQLMMEAGRYDEAIEVGRRLDRGAGAEVSPYKLAETWDRMGLGPTGEGRTRASLCDRPGGRSRGTAPARAATSESTLAQFERERVAGARAEVVASLQHLEDSETRTAI